MKFSELWLRQYVNPPLSTIALSHVLTMAGLEVEAIEPVAATFTGVVIGHVLEVTPHPDADRLRVCQVDVGEPAYLQIVCGASNVFAGARVPCALVGAKWSDMEIKATKLRGVPSAGMLCSAKELGLTDEADGLLILPKNAPIGLSIRAYLSLDDYALTLKLTPNRSDCLSVQGVARELAALTAMPLQLPQRLEYAVAGDAGIVAHIADQQACPLYRVQRLDGLNPAACTPDWMRERLARSGVRSLGAVVDVTNYVLLEMGQPLHAFDAHKITGDLHVRWAAEHEMVTLLNGQRLNLMQDMLVIADQTQVQALAGIMGGAASAVSDTTSSVLIESAYFAPKAVAGRARRIGVATDAAFRFERGVDFGATESAAERAVELLLAICGGVVRPARVLIAELPKRTAIRLRPTRVQQILGVALDGIVIAEYLRRLGCTVQAVADVFDVTPPSHRFDLEIEVDLIEELARLHGYDNIPAITPQAELKMLAQSEQLRSVYSLRNILVARDYQEVITYSFVDQIWENDFAVQQSAVVLQNPIASQMGVMRSSLLGGLIDVLDSNLNRGQTRIRIMEVGRCYHAQDDGFIEPLRLGGLCYGPFVDEQWGVATRPVDFFDVKADLEALCWPEPMQMSAFEHVALHPGQSAQMMLHGEVIGWLGALHPKLVRERQMTYAPIVFELDVPPLLCRAVSKYHELSKFQAVRRDMAVVVNQTIPVQQILDALRASCVKYVTEVALFDDYRGKHIDSDKKSLAFRVHMQDNHRTLTDGDVELAITQLTALLHQKFGAQLRT